MKKMKKIKKNCFLLFFLFSPHSNYFCCCFGFIFAQIFFVQNYSEVRRWDQDGMLKIVIKSSGHTHARLSILFFFCFMVAPFVVCSKWELFQARSIRLTLSFLSFSCCWIGIFDSDKIDYVCKIPTTKWKNSEFVLKRNKMKRDGDNMPRASKQQSNLVFIFHIWKKYCLFY